MQNDFYCFFCSSELDTDSGESISVCFGCEAVFVLTVAGNCVRSISVSTCGSMCTCVEKSNGVIKRE